MRWIKKLWEHRMVAYMVLMTLINLFGITYGYFSGNKELLVMAIISTYGWSRYFELYSGE